MTCAMKYSLESKSIIRSNQSQQCHGLDTTRSMSIICLDRFLCVQDEKTMTIITLSNLNSRHTLT
jgi:hypothetical protein